MPFSPVPQLARSYIRTTLALITIVALIGPLTRSAPPTPAPAPAHARARILNAGIWTVHFGIDNAGRDSQRAMRDLFRDMDLDVVGILETDLHVRRGGLSYSHEASDELRLSSDQYLEAEICA